MRYFRIGDRVLFASTCFFVLFCGGVFAQGVANTGEQLSQPLKSSLYGQDLSQLIAAGLLANPAIASKSKQAESARSGVDGAKWSFFPTPNILLQQARANKNNPSFQGDNKVLQVGLQQPIWAGGRLTAGLTMAEKRLALSMVDLEDAKQQIALRIVGAFASWDSSSQKVLAYQEAVKSYREFETIVRRRIDAGLSPENDYIFAQGRYEQALADLETAKTQKTNALINLGQLLGAPISSEQLISINKPLLMYPINADDLLRQALESNLAVLRAKLQVEIQDTQVSMALSSMAPSLSVSFQRQNGNFAYSNVTTTTQNLVFLNLSAGFGAGLSNFSQISAAKSQKDSAVADELSVKQNLTGEVLSNVANLKAAMYRVKSMDAACIAAYATAQSWQRQFTVGRKGWQDLLNATRELSTCKASLADVKESLLILNWRIAMSSIGLDQALLTSDVK